MLTLPSPAIPYDAQLLDRSPIIFTAMIDICRNLNCGLERDNSRKRNRRAEGLDAVVVCEIQHETLSLNDSLTCAPP